MIKLKLFKDEVILFNAKMNSIIHVSFDFGYILFLLFLVYLNPYNGMGKFIYLLFFHTPLLLLFVFSILITVFTSYIITNKRIIIWQPLNYWTMPYYLITKKVPSILLDEIDKVETTSTNKLFLIKKPDIGIVKITGHNEKKDILSIKLFLDKADQFQEVVLQQIKLIKENKQVIDIDKKSISIPPYYISKKYIFKGLAKIMIFIVCYFMLFFNNPDLVFKYTSYLTIPVTKFMIYFNKNDSIPYFVIAEQYSSRKEYNLAIQNYEKAISLNPANPHYYFGLGRVYYDNNKYSQAIKLFEHVIKIKSDPIYTYFYLGCSYFQKRDYNKAIENFKKDININPNNINSYINLANAFYEKGQYDQAIQYLDSASSIDKNNDLIYLCLAIVYEKENKHNLSMQNYVKFIKLNPKYSSESYYKLVKKGGGQQQVRIPIPTYQSTSRH